MNPTDDLLTIAQAAEMLGVSRQRVHVLIGTYNAETQSPSPRLTLIQRKEVERIRREKAAIISSQNN